MTSALVLATRKILLIMMEMMTCFVVMWNSFVSQHHVQSFHGIKRAMICFDYLTIIKDVFLVHRLDRNLIILKIILIIWIVEQSYFYIILLNFILYKRFSCSVGFSALGYYVRVYKTLNLQQQIGAKCTIVMIWLCISILLFIRSSRAHTYVFLDHM